MELFTTSLTFILYGLTMFTSAMLFCSRRAWKEWFIFKVAIFWVLYIAAMVAFAAIEVFTDSPPWVSYIDYSLASYSVTVFLLFMFKEKKRKLFYNIIAGALVRYSASKIIMCILQFAPLNSAIGTPLLENAFVMLSYIPLYFLFARHIANDADFAPSVREMLFLATITMCILPMAFLEPVLFANSRVGYVYLIVIEVVVGYGMLGFQYLMYYNAKQMAHVVVENELSKRRVEQYEGFRGVVEVMNHKIHDLKHQVRDLAAEHAVNTEVIDGITETVTDYETFIHTGNEPLDTILTEKKFVCVSRKIGMKCIVDGAAFSFLSVEDTNALFGNLLDNATEYLSSVDENFRLLSIFSSRTEHFLKLAVENYFDGDRIELDKKGFPITNKHDTLMHGFGTRSVARIAEKHGGHATFRVEDGLFKAHVIFPTDI